jgi:hypothetical protein
MTRNAGWSFGSLWLDNALPTAIGALCALIIMYQGGPFWSLLAVPLLCWCVWQLTLWSRGMLGLRIGLVTSIALILIAYVFLLFGVDTAKLHQAVADAGIPVNTVSSNRSAVVVNIQPVSWGPERNVALRAIFTAAHTHAKSKKNVQVRWGDAMTSTIEMNDIAAFLAGQITYREMLNRMEWYGTPDVLPDDSSGREAHHRIGKLRMPVDFEAAAITNGYLS